MLPSAYARYCKLFSCEERKKKELKITLAYLFFFSFAPDSDIVFI